MEDKDIKKELDELAPFLHQIRAHESQQLPDDYFGSLRKNIIAQTIDKEPIVAKKKSFFSLAKMAAMAILLIGMAFLIATLLKPEKTDTPIADNTILEYIDTHLSDFDELELGAILDESELSQTDISEEEIINEIDLEDFSIEMLEEQL